MLETKNSKFYLNGEEFKIYSGAIHYFRIPKEYWEDRLLKLKLCGFNTVETYVAWNMHEPKKGEFNFLDMLDIVAFIKAAQKVGLYAIVRPGPYICAEWDFGGFPAWLLKDKNLRLRCMDEKYLIHVKDFFKKLIPMLVPLQHSNGGNIIAFQVENEYGSYGNDHEYIDYIEDLLISLGVKERLFTSDGATDFMMTGGSKEGMFKVANFGSGYLSGFNKLRAVQNDMPCMCGEFWCGWFDHWGEKHHTRKINSVMYDLKGFLKEKGSFNFYMFCGGTNFGFGAGSNHSGKLEPTVTSYDYNAPLTEWGDYTPLYFAVRAILYENQGMTLGSLPEIKDKGYVGRVKLNLETGLRENSYILSKKYKSPSTESMEYYDQNFGIINYKTFIKGKYESMMLNIDEVHDLAYVYFNKNLIAKFDRRDYEEKGKIYSIHLPGFDNGAELEIVVSHFGRVNYGPKIYDRKGISGVRIGQQELFNWEVNTYSLNNLEKTNYKNGSSYPKILKGNFDVEKMGDCFVHTSTLKKGYIFVNGHNLGRYMDEKPQGALYLPAVWLKPTNNEIVVVELEGEKDNTIVIDNKFDLG